MEALEIDVRLLGVHEELLLQSLERADVLLQRANGFHEFLEDSVDVLARLVRVLAIRGVSDLGPTSFGGKK